MREYPGLGSKERLAVDDRAGGEEMGLLYVEEQQETERRCPPLECGWREILLEGIDQKRNK